VGWLKLGWRGLVGTDQQKYYFTDGSKFVEEVKKSWLAGFRRKEMRGELIRYCAKKQAGRNPTLPRLRLGGEIPRVFSDENALIHKDVDYPVMQAIYFFVDRNPTSVYLGSFTGGSIEVTKIDCCTKTATIHWHALDIKSARSAFRLPQFLGGYGEGGGRTFLNIPDNPLGDGNPFNTLTIEMEWNEELKFK